jgi:hypothetical protein
MLGVSARAQEVGEVQRDTAHYLTQLLLPVLDDRGVEGWLHRPRPQYGDLTPLQMIDAGEDDLAVSLALDLVRTA